MPHPDYVKSRPNNFLTANEITQILKSSNSIAYHSSLEDYTASPLHQLTKLAEWLGVNKIFIKDESQRFGLNSFKVLGASYAIKKLLETQPNIHTFCTATDGNHGKAVAYSARMHKKKAVILVPEYTTGARIRSIKDEQAKVICFKGNYDETCKEAERLSVSKGWQLIQDVAWEGYEKIPALIMSGYLSMFKEMEKLIHTPDHPLVDVVFLQAGAGSFASSAVWYYLNRYRSKKPKIVIVEPMQCDGILESFKQKELSTTKGKQATIMAGLNCGTPSSIAWPILQSGADVIMRIDDHYTEEAIQMLYHPLEEDPRIIAGESGAAGMAAFISILKENKFKPLLKYLDIKKNSRLLFFNTEGDTDPENFRKIIASI